MAKGNMLQGMARGKVGDIVFSRLNGEQISRVRNRNPKNPRTNAQLYQRAIMATVMQAYSAGKEIFDHSFQGKSIGAANQRRFMSLNAKKLRDQIAADIDGNVAVANQVGRVIGPGVQSPTPCILQVSEGSLTDVIFDNSVIPDTIGEETIAHYCNRLGLTEGDIYTYIAFVCDNSDEPIFSVANITGEESKQYKTLFKYARYQIKNSALSNNNPISNYSDIFELTDSNDSTAKDLSTIAPGDDEVYAFGNVFNLSISTFGVAGWIRSKKDYDLRSNSELHFVNPPAGIASEYALAAWKQGTAALGDSDLILEGGDI